MLKNVLPCATAPATFGEFIMSDAESLPLEALSLSITGYIACSKCADEASKATRPPLCRIMQGWMPVLPIMVCKYGVGGIRSMLCILIFRAIVCRLISAVWKPAKIRPEFSVPASQTHCRYPPRLARQAHATNNRLIAVAKIICQPPHWPETGLIILCPPCRDASRQ